MAIQTLSGGLMEWPRKRLISPNQAANNFTIDASGERIAVIFRVPKTGNIDRVVFWTGSVTASDTLGVRIETVNDTTGDPTGTAYGSMTDGTQASLSANTQYEVTLGTAAAATAGDIVAAVIDFDSFVSGNLQIAHYAQSSGGSTVGFPYVDHFTTAWAKSATTMPAIAIRYDDATYQYIGAVGALPPTQTNFNSSSTPDEMGNYFSLPFPVTVAGFNIQFDGDNDCDVVLYDSDGSTPLMSFSLDSNIRGFANYGEFELIKPSSAWVQLAANTNYRLVFKPTTTSNVQVTELVVSASALRSQLPGGSLVQKTSRTDAGSWTQTDTRALGGLSLIIAGADDAASGGIKRCAPLTGGAV